MSISYRMENVFKICVEQNPQEEVGVSRPCCMLINVTYIGKLPPQITSDFRIKMCKAPTLNCSIPS